MQLLDGRKLSKKIELQITDDVKKLKESCGCTPGLAVVLVVKTQLVRLMLV